MRTRAHGAADLNPADTPYVLLSGRGSGGQTITDPLTVNSPADANTLIATRNTALTNTTRGPIVARHVTSGEMADGFGVGVLLQVEDASSGNLNVGRIDTARNGADNSADLILKSSSAGALVEGLRILPSGNVQCTAAVKSTSASAGLGYDTGAGSTVSQGSGSGKATAVTINAICGQITTDTATLNAGVEVSFTVNNSSIATTDCVVVNHDSGGTLGAYGVFANAIGATSFAITITNLSGSNLGEALVLNFVIIKAVTS